MRAWTLFATSLALAACLGRQDGASPSGELRIAVAPLSLPGLVDACYALAVTNEDNAPVWSRSELCASRFGSQSGDLSYVGTCDASDSDLDGDAANTVTLTILRLLGPPATEGGDPVALTDWQNPCAAPHNANGCQLSVACRENADSRVDFDLTILRDARQGFFDVAVSFDDLFCSAKVDCADEDGPLLLVHGPDGTRVPSVVLGLTCTDGDAATSVSDTTHLYLDPVAIRCGASRWEIAPWLGPGNLYPTAGALPPPIVQAMVFRGVQALGPDNVDTVYWNTALGLNTAFFAAQTTGTSCILETRATASRGPLEDGLTPASAIHPIIEIAVTLNSGSTMTCTQHPLNGEPPNDGVRTSYAGTSQLPGPLSFAAVARRGLSGQVESFFVDACADCDVNASCQPAAPENERCDCLPGFFGDGETCTPCSPIAHCGGDLTCTVLTDSSCSSCEPGYEEPDCSNIDECVTGPAPCDPNATCTDTDGDYSCACKPGFFGDGETCTACTTVAQCEGQVTCTSSTDSACADCAEGFGGPNCIAARVVFDYTGALQNYTVPAGVTAISVRLWGAGGGACSGSAGGGGYASGTLAVTAGQSLSVLVGGAGSYPSGGTGGAGGFGGGGAGGNGLANAFDSGGCGGGGRSEVVHVGGTLTAGGGGGSGAGGVPGTTAAGGGATGQSGSQTTACYGNGTGGASGSGGGGGVGGAGGTGCANGANGSGNGLAGVALTGGQGGSDTSTARGRGGGGGGGGFGGGGGGGASDSWSCGVGGGGGGRTIAGGLTVTGSQATPAMSSDPQRGTAGAPDQPGRVVFDLTF